MAKFRRCQQLNCGYFVNGGCKKCDECNAKPFHINTSCNSCLCCENVQDSLRWGDNEQFNEQKQEQELKLAELIFKIVEEIENEN